jgi:hypothetical protein
VRAQLANLLTEFHYCAGRPVVFDRQVSQCFEEAIDRRSLDGVRGKREQGRQRRRTAENFRLAPAAFDSGEIIFPNQDEPRMGGKHRFRLVQSRLHIGQAAGPGDGLDSRSR